MKFKVVRNIETKEYYFSVYEGNFLYDFMGKMESSQKTKYINTLIIETAIAIAKFTGNYTWARFVPENKH
jgi:hypothetical protein